MRRISKTLIVLFISVLCLSNTALADDYTPINDLIENSIKYDNKEFKIKGEAIGEKMARGDHGWVNINDGTNAIGIWLTEDMMKQIEVLGDYKHRGDTIEVIGEFHRDCKEHGGDVDVHAKSIVKLTRGQIDIPVVKNNRIMISMVIIASTLVLSLMYIKVRNSKA